MKGVRVGLDWLGNWYRSICHRPTPSCYPFHQNPMKELVENAIKRLRLQSWSLFQLMPWIHSHLQFIFNLFVYHWTFFREDANLSLVFTAELETFQCIRIEFQNNRKHHNQIKLLITRKILEIMNERPKIRNRDTFERVSTVSYTHLTLPTIYSV